jgi:hypothetical protein
MGGDAKMTFQRQSMLHRRHTIELDPSQQMIAVHGKQTLLGRTRVLSRGSRGSENGWFNRRVGCVP